MEAIAVLDAGVMYSAGIDSLEACGIYKDFQDCAFGGMPAAINVCWYIRNPGKRHRAPMPD